MRQGNNNNRQRNRGRSGRKPQGQNPNRALDINGPGGRLRGTAQQLAEKYTALARDARSSKDRVVVESMLQHAEHYQRLVNEASEAQAKQREQQEANRRERQEGGNGADTKGDQQPAEPAAEVSAQPDIAASAGGGEQPQIDIPAAEETPAPARRQRRSSGQRRTRTPKVEANGADAPEAAAPVETAEAAPEAPSAELSE